MSGRFFAEIFGKYCRNRQQMHQNQHCFPPEFPNRQQPAGQRAEKQDRAARGTQQHEAPQLSLPPAQDEGQRSQGHRQAVGPVQQRRQPGQSPPQGAQQVVQHPGSQTQQHRLGKQQKLLRGLVPQAHPNRRLKKPPRPACSSS